MPVIPKFKRNEGISAWKVIIFVAVAGTVCSYLWITREVCFKAWLISRMFETKYFKEILHPLHFPEAKDPTTTPADEANAMRKRRKVVDVLIEKTIVQAEMEEIHDVILPVKDGEIPMRVYVPASGDPRQQQTWANDNGSGSSKGVLIWLHGGGWMFGSILSAENMGKDLASSTGMIVVAVAYRLAPEVRFPVPIKDCLAAVRWVKTYIHHFGGDARRLALVGESSGGNLAMATALFMGKSWLPFTGAAAKKNLCAVVAASPLLSYQHALEGKGEEDGEWHSYRRYWTGYGIEGSQMKGYWDAYLRSLKDGQSSFASPLRASHRQLRKLPPVLLFRAAHEVLWDEVTEMGRKIANAGGDVEEWQGQGCIHGMYAKAGSVCGKESLEKTARYLQKYCG